MTTTIERVTKCSAVIRLGPRAWALATRTGYNASWRVLGGGPAGEGGSWCHENLGRLAQIVEKEHCRFGHISCERTRKAARELAKVYDAI